MTSLLKSMPRQERPRERLTRYGKEGVSAVELLAILLGSGTKSRSVLQLATEILAHFGSLKALANASLSELKQMKGIGTAKALQLQAAFGLFHHFEEEPKKVFLKTPQAVYELIRSDLEQEKIEVLLVILRDVKRCLIHREILARGTLTEILIHPREVYHAAIRHRAHSAIIAHNHPSGDPTPSTRDLEMTGLLAAAGGVVGIELIDHIIVGKNSFTSLSQKGMFRKDSY